MYAPEDFGAAGNGATDDSAAINSCLSAAASHYGGCYLAAKKYFAATTVTVPQFSSLEGQKDPAALVSNVASNTSVPQILLGSGTTVNLSGRLANVVIARSGVVQTTAANTQAALANLALYSGTGITLQNAADMDHVYLLGFALGIDTNSQADWHIRHVRGDAVAGIFINGMHDFSWIEDMKWVGTTASCVAPTTTSVSAAANNGSGLIRLTVTSTTQMATGNTIVVYGVTGTTEANGRWVATIVDGTHIDLQTSTFTNTWVSGGTVMLSSCNRTGPAYKVQNSEAPLIYGASEYGYDTVWDIGTLAGWTTVYGLDIDDNNIPDPGKIGINIHGSAYASKLYVGFASSVWTPLIVNTTGGTAADPHLIEGGSLYSTAPAGSTTAGIQLLAGTAALENVSTINTIIQIASGMKVRFTGVSGAGSTWLSGSNFANVTSSGSEFGDLTGTDLRGSQLNLELQNGTSWINAMQIVPNGAQGQVNINGFLAVGAGNAITSNPPAPYSNLGWKIGLYGAAYAIGVEGFTIAAKTGGWFSVFSGNPNGDASGTVPDSAANVSLGTNGVVRATSFTAAGSAGVSCAANTVSLTTLVVTAGIVTHC